MTRLVPATPAARVLAALSAAVAAGVVVGTRGAPARSAVVTLAVTAAAAAITALALGRRWPALAAGTVLLFACGALRGGMEAPAHLGAESGAIVLRGTVRDAPVIRRGETVLVVAVDMVSPPVAGLSTVAFAVLGRTDALPGDRVEVQATSLHAPTARPGPLSAAVLDRGGIDAVATSPRVTILSRGGVGVARMIAVVRGEIAATVDASAPEPQATLTSSIAFGVRGALPADLDRALRDSGLIHLVATSGLKVAIVAGLVARLLSIVALGPRLRVAVGGAAVAAYVVLAGGGAAATRSALMGGVALGLSGTGRRAEPVTLLAVVAAVLLLADPRMAADAGFQLSFLGTLGIIALAGSVARRVPGPRLLVEPFAVTLAAQVATLPVTAATFGTVSLVGPVANALVLPLIPALVSLALLGAVLSAAVPGLGWPAFQLAAGLSWAVAAIARVCASLPGAAIQVTQWPAAWTVVELLAVVAAAAAFRLHRYRTSARVDVDPMRGNPRESGAHPLTRGHRIALGAAALLAPTAAGGLAVTAARPDGRLHVTVLAAGAGPSVLVRTPGGGLALVDGGSDPLQLITALGSALPPLTRTIDEVVLTGGERTAVAGLADIGAHYAVATVIVPDADLGTAARAEVLALREAGATIEVVPLGGSWAWDGAAWRFVEAGRPDGGALVQPLCALEVRAAGGGALLLGDLAPPAQEEVLAAGGAGLRSDLLVAPPSGLLAPALVAAVQPREIAITGAHPPTVRIDAAPPPGTRVRSTGADGTLQYRSGPDGGLEPA